MNIIKVKQPLSYLLGAMALAAANAMAEEAAPTAAASGGGLRQYLDKFPGGGWGLATAILVVVVVAIAFTIFSGRRREDRAEAEVYPEPTTMMESSKFEQLLAETQGLYLRIQGGESKGYYRKIEQLARIFLERIGMSGARQMTFEEILGILGGGNLPQKQSGALISIFERCKQGSEHEGEKIDFTAAELIKDLRGLIKAAAEEHSPSISTQ